MMIINIFQVSAFANEEQSLEEIIRPQVEAFAKSIDKKDADGGAQDALVTHGMFGGGKKLSAGKDHALTATIVNSELGKEFLTAACVKMIETANEQGTDKGYSLGLLRWLIENKNNGDLYIYDYNAKKYLENNADTCPADYLRKDNIKSQRDSAYDDTLELIAGKVDSDIDLTLRDSDSDKITYEVNVVFWDDFDFSDENGSTLEKLLGFMGMLLFNPFEWESKFSFQIEVPIEKPEMNTVFGDADGNGEVTVADAYFARLAAAKLIVPTEEQLLASDIDGDGRITAIDANLIRRFAVGIIKELPVSG